MTACSCRGRGARRRHSNSLLERTRAIYPALSKRALRWLNGRTFSGTDGFGAYPKRQDDLSLRSEPRIQGQLHLTHTLGGTRGTDARLKRQELASVPFIIDVKRDLDEEAERFRDLSMEEVARLLGSGARSAPVTVLPYQFEHTSSPDAVLDLRPAQVDLKRRLVNLNPKGRKQTKKIGPSFRSRRPCCRT